ncbi:MAG TPA: hypothetical protein VF306_00145 [Pirellulales bacterium]
MPIFRDWEYGEITGFDDWQMEEVGYIQLAEGHRYRVEVDPEQLRELTKYRHRLGVDLAVTEKMNWAERKNPNWREARKAREAQKAKKKEWDPRELEKARAARRRWEAEKARLYRRDDRQ